MGWIAKPLGDQRLKLFGDVVLEHLGFVVNPVPRHSELGEQQLQQAMVANHFERNGAASLG